MLLAIDVGNTQTVVGQFLEGNWSIDRFDTTKINLLDRLQSISNQEIVCASVVPYATELIHSVQPQTFFLTLDMVPWFKSNYTTPKTLGADRLANAIAVSNLYSLPAFVIDFGTATKLDAIDSTGTHLGGSIAVGLKTSMLALTENTALLKEVNLEGNAELIGSDTISCLRSGVINGLANMVSGFVKQYREMLGQSSTCVVTGGLAPIILSQIEEPAVFDPLLTLRGLQIAHERKLL